MNSSEIRDFLERTVPHLPYPLKKSCLTVPVVAVTTGTVDTSSTSSGWHAPHKLSHMLWNPTGVH